MELPGRGLLSTTDDLFLKEGKSRIPTYFRPCHNKEVVKYHSGDMSPEKTVLYF